MTRRILVAAELSDQAPGTWEGWTKLEGPQLARSSTTESRQVLVSGIPLFLKRQRYPFRNAIRAALRNTFLGRSRAAREHEMLRIVRDRAGPDFAPQPAALGESRFLRLLREAFLATFWVEGATPISETPPADPEAARRLGRFLRELHDAGVCHGSLFDRNVLVRPDGSYCVVDLDRATARRPGMPAAERDRARDLACLTESLASLPLRIRLRIVRAYAGKAGALRRWLRAIEPFRAGARRRLDRRRAV